MFYEKGGAIEAHTGKNRNAKEKKYIAMSTMQEDIKCSHTRHTEWQKRQHILNLYIQ